MTTAITPYRPSAMELVPAAIADAGDRPPAASVEFFTANIRNPNTRRAYAQAVAQFFGWCEERGLTLRAHRADRRRRLHRAAQAAGSPPLGQAAPRRHPDALRLARHRPGRARSTRPRSVSGPKHVVKKGKTPVLAAGRRATLLDSIPSCDRSADRRRAEPVLIGLRDRALIARHGLQLRPRRGRARHEGRGLLPETASAGGSGCTRRAASSTRCPPTTTPRSTSTPISRPPASRDDRKGPLFRSAVGGRRGS